MFMQASGGEGEWGSPYSQLHTGAKTRELQGAWDYVTNRVVGKQLLVQSPNNKGMTEKREMVHYRVHTMYERIKSDHEGREKEDVTLCNAA